jgi:hypothetical protein
MNIASRFDVSPTAALSLPVKKKWGMCGWRAVPFFSVRRSMDGLDEYFMLFYVLRFIFSANKRLTLFDLIRKFII